MTSSLCLCVPPVSLSTQIRLPSTGEPSLAFFVPFDNVYRLLLFRCNWPSPSISSVFYIEASETHGILLYTVWVWPSTIGIEPIYDNVSPDHIFSQYKEPVCPLVPISFVQCGSCHKYLCIYIYIYMYIIDVISPRSLASFDPPPNLISKFKH